jgi:endoglycosylceramidase
MTEWGALAEDQVAVEDIDNFLNIADGYLQSWSYWQFKSFNDITTAAKPYDESFYDGNGNLQAAKVQHLSRTYAYAIAG